MNRVVRKQTSFDQDLAEVGQIRVYRCDFVTTLTGLAPIYRETTMQITHGQLDLSPWWTRKTTKSGRLKS